MSPLFLKMTSLGSLLAFPGAPWAPFGLPLASPGAQNDPKTSKWSPKASQKSTKNQPKSTPGLRRCLLELQGLILEVQGLIFDLQGLILDAPGSIFDLKMLIFGPLQGNPQHFSFFLFLQSPCFGVHVNPKGGRRDPALRAEYTKLPKK